MLQALNTFAREGLAIDDLKRKQSFRFSFRLRAFIIERIGAIAGQFGRKQKTLLDQLLEDNALLE